MGWLAPRALSLAAIAIITACLLLFASTASPADDDWQPSNYQQRFEAPNKGVRLKDNNVWVYERSFAERFGMPERWIDEDLKGAEAVAYRVEAKNTRSCGYFGETDNCRTNYYCVFDLYLSDSDSERLPWKTDRKVGFAKEDTSVPFLSAQSRSDQKGWDEDEQRYDRSRLNIGIDTMSWVSGPPTEGKVFSASSDRVRVQSYDRKIFEGLDYIKLATDCNIAKRKHHVRIFFHEKFPKPVDYGFRYVGEALRASPEDEARFKEAERAWYTRLYKGDVRHALGLPDRYMIQVNEYNRAVYDPKSLAAEAERRERSHDTIGEKKNWLQKLFGSGE